MQTKIDIGNFSKIVEIFKNENSFFLIKNLKDLLKFQQELSVLYSYILIEGFKNFKDDYNACKTIRLIMEDIDKLNFNNDIKKDLYYKFLIYTMKDIKYGKFEFCNELLNNYENFNEKEKTEFYSEMVLSLKYLENYEAKTILGNLQNKISQFTNTENVNTFNSFLLTYYIEHLEKSYTNDYKTQKQDFKTLDNNSLTEVFNNLNLKMQNFLNEIKGVNNYSYNNN